MPKLPPMFPSPDSVVPLLPPTAFWGGISWWGKTLTCGGVERQIIELAKYLTGIGFKLHFFCDTLEHESGCDFFLDDAQKLFRSILALDSLPARFEAHSSSIHQALAGFNLEPFYMKRAFFCMEYFLAVRPRIVQVWNADFPEVALAAVLAGVPKIIVSARSLPPNKRFPLGLESVDDVYASKIYKFLIPFPSIHFTANSKAGLVAYEDWLGLPANSICLATNLLSMGQWYKPPQSASKVLRASLNIPEQAPVLGGLIRFSEIKDPSLWILTAVEVLRNNPDAYAVLGGEGPMRQGLVDGVAQTPFKDRLILPGIINDSSLFFSILNVFLLTSFLEGLPNVLLEAHSHSLPIVTTNAGGASDVVLHGESGFVVNERDPLALAKYIQYILSNQQWALQAGEAGKKHIQANFSPEAAASPLCDLYA